MGRTLLSHVHICCYTGNVFDFVSSDRLSVLFVVLFGIILVILKCNFKLTTFCFPRLGEVTHINWYSSVLFIIVPLFHFFHWTKVYGFQHYQTWGMNWLLPGTNALIHYDMFLLVLYCINQECWCIDQSIEYR